MEVYYTSRRFFSLQEIEIYVHNSHFSQLVLSKIVLLNVSALKPVKIMSMNGTFLAVCKLADNSFPTAPKTVSAVG